MCIFSGGTLGNYGEDVLKTLEKNIALGPPGYSVPVA